MALVVSGAIQREANAWVEVNLEPGTYGIACMLPDFAAESTEHAQSHLDLGMVRVLTIE